VTGAAKHIVPVRVLPGKEKTAAKGDTLTAVFLLIVNFQSISLSSLDTEVNRWSCYPVNLRITKNQTTMLIFQAKNYNRYLLIVLEAVLLDSTQFGFLKSHKYMAFEVAN